MTVINELNDMKEGTGYHIVDYPNWGEWGSQWYGGKPLRSMEWFIHTMNDCDDEGKTKYKKMIWVEPNAGYKMNYGYDMNEWD